MTGGPKEKRVSTVIDRARFDAVIFDMDGVVTDTARVHMEAWKRLFDDFLRSRAEHSEESFRPFTDADYQRYVDGKLRQDGVRSFLASRGIAPDEGSADDPPEAGTVRGLGNAKNAYFLELLASQGAGSFPHAVDLVRRLQEARIATAIISASRNAKAVLASAGVLDLFAVRVDGVVAAELGLPGKPDPAVFLEAADRLGVPPDRAVVVEDAQAGVAAGRAGGFGLVIGVDRGDESEELRARGAHVVVADLSQVQLTDEGRRRDDE